MEVSSTWILFLLPSFPLFVRFTTFLCLNMSYSLAFRPENTSILFIFDPKDPEGVEWQYKLIPVSLIGFCSDFSSTFCTEYLLSYGGAYLGCWSMVATSWFVTSAIKQKLWWNSRYALRSSNSIDFIGDAAEGQQGCLGGSLKSLLVVVAP